MTTTEQLLRDLADRAELADLVARHSVWIDEGRWDETDRIFTADVTTVSPRGTAHGTDELLALVKKGHDVFAQTVHNKANVVIDLDGDTATVRATDLALFVVDDTAVSLAAGIAHYEARRTGAGWRISGLRIAPAALTANIDRAAI
ncbi:hypothetical protein GCM10009853_066260 [Glycomyces scopariae]|uniref:SnoaL-like domain-containing protein n=1 Tax=Glycomyces sambucus TaxID=380244 RepID=A0A1G9H4R2_9ACTN|nr:nuclear transport factor 2 family protein [Glycomyces sambucus]SDL07774.1 SnoaL-like domain-containing protein [Glycomyces sambucus]